jgi:hypothetical protein
MKIGANRSAGGPRVEVRGPEMVADNRPLLPTGYRQGTRGEGNGRVLSYIVSTTYLPRNWDRSGG